MKKLLLLGVMVCLSVQLLAQSFVQQVGQITDTGLIARTDIDFKVKQAGGLQVFVGKGALHYQWIESEKHNDSTVQYHAYRMDMQLVGANLEATLALGTPLSSYERYYLSWVNTDNANTGKVAHQYQSILYKDIYPNIDWHLYFTDEGDLEYDFIVHPGGDISKIRWVYSGHESISLTAHGDLEIYTPKGTILQKAPVSFEQSSRLSVASNYVLQGNAVSFQTGSYEGVLVIDPVIKWGTYFGDVADDYCHGIAVDSIGNAYMIGTTNSVNNIATQGSHQQTFSGGTHYLGADGFINKLDADGQLIWATYYGGSNIDMLNAIAIDSAGFLYIAGYSNSASGIASDSAFQVSKKGTANRYDAILLKFNTEGIRQWATYFGGAMNDGDDGVALAIDYKNQIWIAGKTLSNDIFITSNAHRKVRQFSDGFIASFSLDGMPTFGAYVGGNGEETIKAIAIDSLQHIYVLGESLLSTDMATPNAYQVAIGGNVDAFIAKLDSVATPIWCTYIGGINNDVANAMALTDSNVIVGISTNNSNLEYGNAFQVSNNNYDGLIVDISKDGSMNMISYLGGNGSESIQDIQVMNSAIHILLTTNSTNLNIDTNALFPNNIGGIDLAWFKYSFNWDLEYASYLGGTDEESLPNITFYDQYIFISGGTKSNNNISTPNTYQVFNAGTFDAFLIKIADCNAINWASQGILGADSICPNQASVFQVNAQDSVVYHWLLPNNWQGSSDSNQIVITPSSQDGTIAVWISNSCDLVSDTLLKTVGVFPTQKPLIQKQGNVLVCPQSFTAYQWLFQNDSITGATQNTHIPTQNGWYQLQVIDNKSCMHRSDSFWVDYLSISNIELSTLHIYPNPAQSVVHIKSVEAGSMVIYNVLGQEMYTMQITAGEQTITTATWLSGIYTMVLQTSKGRVTYKLIKE